MKNGAAFLICFLIFFNSKSQVRVAIAGGPQSASVKESNNPSIGNDVKKNYNSRIGIHMGFTADIPISVTSPFYFQPSIQVSNKGRTFSANYDTSASPISNVNGLQHINYIEIPLNLVYKKEIGKKNKLLVGAGPYFSFFYDGKEKTETYYKNGDFEVDENNDLPVGNAAGKYKTQNLGGNIFLGIEFGKAFIKATYSRGFSSFYSSPDHDGSFRHTVIGATFGVFLGKPMIPVPKLKDKDNDGIMDIDDNCPTEKGAIFTKGCPDQDGDGVADKDDYCRENAGSLKYKGCPTPDSDKDSLNDDDDVCPEIFGFIKYKGCPIPDTDNDGMNDEMDKCPEIQGPNKNNGCPIPDSDGDSISDDEDKCPAVVGIKENDGCPEIEKEIIKKIEYAASKIQFKILSSVIMPESYQVLNDILIILNDNPELKVIIEGHTSIDGNADLNMKLSQERADNVKKYLETKGIEAHRLKAEGFGTSKPLNNSKSETEKAMNRRVEIKLSN